MPKKTVDTPDTREETYRFIIAYKCQHDGNSPNYRTIMENTRLSSFGHVSYILAKLQAEGRIRLGDGASRSIEVVGGKYIPPAGYECEPTE